MTCSIEAILRAFPDSGAPLQAVLAAAATALAPLRRDTGLAAELAVPAGDGGLLVAALGTDDAVAGPLRHGPAATATAIGQALAAAMPRTGRADAGLDLVAARGYAIDPGSFAADRAGVAAAVVTAGGAALAAIGLAGPAAQLPPERLHALGAALVEASRAPTALAGGALRPLSRTEQPAQPPAVGLRRLPGPCSLLGESPLYDPASDCLWWVDMYAPAIHRLDRGATTPLRFDPGEMVTALALHPDGLLAAAQSGLWLLDPQSGARRHFLGDPEGGVPTSRFNDGRCDRSGRFWVNTVDQRFAPGQGALYRLDDDGGFARMDAGMDVPNGMAWSPEGRVMYLADTGRRTIYAYDHDPAAGEISGRRVFARLPDDATGAPDGLDVDAQGDLWVAQFDGWRLNRYAPSGDLREEVVLPVPRPTSCRFGGPDGRTLFVTSARIRLSEAGLRAAPDSGATFALST